MKNLIFIIYLSIFISLPAIAEDQKASSKLLNKIDELFRSKGSWAIIEMEIISPDFERTLKMKSQSKGRDFTFISILSPRKDKGVSTLKRGNEMWNYFPKINKVIKVPPSMMMGSWMGSDFTNDDLVKDEKLSEDYIVSSRRNDQGQIKILLKQNTQF